MTEKKDKSEVAQVNRKPTGPKTLKSAVANPKAAPAKPKSAVAKPKTAGVTQQAAPAKPKAATAKPKAAPAKPKSAVAKPAAVKAKSVGAATVRPKRVKSDPVEPAQQAPPLAPAPAESSLTKPKSPKPHGILHYLGVGISAGLLALVVLIAVMAIVLPAATGSMPMTILTGSMTPTYPPGTLVIVRPVDPSTLVIGDPITYQIESGKPAVVTHRIIAITSVSDGTRTYTTQGDANNTADPKPVLGIQVRGKVWYSIPYLGWVNTVVNGESRAWLIPLIAVALFGYAGYQAASAIVGKLKKRRQAESDSEQESEQELVAGPTDK